MNYQRKNISQGYGCTSNAKPNFFLVSFFPTAYFYDTAYYIILHYFLYTNDCNRYFGQHETLSSKTNVLHQIIQLFILLKCMCLIIDMSTHMVHSFIIHRFFQCVFANCCYRFQPFFVHRYFHMVFQRCFLGNFLKIFS